MISRRRHTHNRLFTLSALQSASGLYCENQPLLALWLHAALYLPRALAILVAGTALLKAVAIWPAGLLSDDAVDSVLLAILRAKIYNGGITIHFYSIIEG